MTLILNDDDVMRIVSMPSCIDALEEAFRDLRSGTAVNAPRRDSFMASGRDDAYYSFKTIEGGLESLGVMAQRINSDLITHPVIAGGRRRVKVPAAPGDRYVGLIFLYSSETLELLAIMTDGQLQRMRVAGTSAVGAKYLSREDSRVVGLLGAGWQAGAAAEALASVRALSTIKVFSPNVEHRESFAEEMSGELGIDVLPVDSAREAVSDSDMVACATNSATEVVKGAWVEEGMHLTSIRAHEFDEEAWRRSDAIVLSGPPGSQGYSNFGTSDFEHHHRASEREGERTLTEDERFERYRGKAHMLSDLLADKVPRRTTSSQVTMMNKNWGLGIEFAAAAKVAYDRAKEDGAGVEIATEYFSQLSHP